MKILFILILMSCSFIVNSNEFLENYKVIKDNKVSLDEKDNIKENYIVNYEKINFQTNAQTNAQINNEIVIGKFKDKVFLENVEKNNNEDVDILLDEATSQISNKEIIKNEYSKVQSDYNDLLLNKIKDLEQRVIRLESLLENKIEEI